MRKIYTIGETVFDIMFVGGRPTGGNPGGSVLNSAVTLGRLGLQPVFLSDFCDDLVGKLIARFLHDNDVTPQQLVDGSSMQTSIAIAFLDDNGDARYEFYKQKPQSPDMTKFAADFQKDDILLFGSYYAIMPEIREGVRQLVTSARRNGAIVVYDPNFRRPHLKDLPVVRPFIEENISLADVVKGSDEDFSLVFGSSSQSIAFDILRNINRNAMFFYTKGKDGCACYQRGITLEYTAPPIKPISTIGAGDNFNAGVVYGIIKNNLTHNDLRSNVKKEIVDDIVDYATRFAQEVCNVIRILGDEEQMAAFEESAEKMRQHVLRFNALREEDILDIVKGRRTSDEIPDGVVCYSMSGRAIKARSENQQKLIDAYHDNDMVFAVGPAGTGKTYLSIALAVKALKEKAAKKIILSRPAVEAGEKLGFLPGDMKDKIDPYLQPLYDALEDMLPQVKLQEMMEHHIIQIAPLAFMRGRTLSDAVVILDEAQNTTPQQIRMFLTRMGWNTKMIITGDMTQIDLPRSQKSGLVEALNILKDIEGIGIVELNRKDIVRHKLVTRIVNAYEHFDKENKPEQENHQPDFENQ